MDLFGTVIVTSSDIRWDFPQTRTLVNTLVRLIKKERCGVRDD